MSIQKGMTDMGEVIKFPYSRIKRPLIEDMDEDVLRIMIEMRERLPHMLCGLPGRGKSMMVKEIELQTRIDALDVALPEHVYPYPAI